MILWAIRSQQLIRNRPPKFLAGRAFTAQEIQDIQETVQLCVVERVGVHGLRAPGLGDANGRYKEKSCASALRRLEALGLVKLPALQPASGTDAEEEIVGKVRDVAPFQLEPVGEKQAVRLWKENVARYHPLGYRPPFGARQRYFLMGRGERRLGCLRRPLGRWRSGTAGLDGGIGWSQQDRARG
jgi:hypothetical protein